jgi:SOS regulatory protein LexA
MPSIVVDDAGLFLEHEAMPRDRELMALTGLRSTHAVCTHVERLLDPEPHEHPTAYQLLLRQRYAALPVLGTVSAGFPSPADEELTDTMSLDDYLIGNKEATYILKVNGESMLGAGILPGDMLLVERGAEPRDGDIVIAQVDREWTMKFFRRRGRRVFLEAANQDFKPIFPTEELKVAAVVRAVIRKYP